MNWRSNDLELRNDGWSSNLESKSSDLDLKSSESEPSRNEFDWKRSINCCSYLKTKGNNCNNSNILVVMMEKSSK
jgi:hypothetical protein